MTSALLLLMLAAQAGPIASRPLPDPELAEQRGGFRLPNGVDVALTVQTQTALDGAVVLRTVFRADQGAPTLTVFTPKVGATVAAETSTNVGAAAGGSPSVSYDPRNGIQVTPGAAMPAITVSSGPTDQAAADTHGLEAVDASAGVATAAGQVTATRTSNLDTVRLDSGDLTITHFAGAAFGSAIENTGNDRAIDTVTSVAIDLSNAGPDVVGSALLRVQDLGSSISATRAQ